MAAQGALLRHVKAEAPPTPSFERYEFAQQHMGMEFRLVLYATHHAAANQAARAVWDRIAALDRCASDYDPDSELMRLGREGGPGRPLPVSDDLWRILVTSNRWSEESGGAFDVTVGPLVRLWRRARRQHALPPAASLEEARQVVGYRHLTLLESPRRVELRLPGMRLDLGGVAVGFAVDESLQVLRQWGITAALLDGSGDIGALGAPPGSAGWRVRVAPLFEAGGERLQPSRYVELRDAAVSTSGDAFQFVEIDGARYSHIVDPHTGLGLTTPCSVTVVAADCLTADVLATAVSVLGPEAGLKLVSRRPGAAAFVVRNIDGRQITTSSAGADGTVFLRESGTTGGQD